MLKMSIAQSSLLPVVTRAAAVTPVKTSAEYLRYVWLKAADNSCLVQATNSSVDYTAELYAVVDNPGLIGINAKELHAFVKTCKPSDMIRFTELADSKVQVSVGSRQSVFKTHEPGFYQDFKTCRSNDEVFKLQARSLIDAINNVKLSIDTNLYNDALNCLYLNGREVCGLCGHTFARQRMVAMLPANTLIRLSDTKLLLKLLDKTAHIEMWVTEKRLFIKQDSETISMPLCPYDFPDYNCFLNKVSDKLSLRSLTIDRKALKQALAGLGLSKTDKCVTLSFSEGSLTLEVIVDNDCVSRSTLPCEHTCDGFQITWNGVEMQKILGVFESPFVKYWFSSKEGPMLIEGDGARDAGLEYVSMPMKIAEPPQYADEN